MIERNCWLVHQAMSFEFSSLSFTISVCEVCKKSILAVNNSFFSFLTRNVQVGTPHAYRTIKIYTLGGLDRNMRSQRN